MDLDSCQRPVATLHLAPISARKNVGIDALFSGILQSIQASVDDILADSIHIKLHEVLAGALSQLELYKAALNLPIDNLEAKNKELNQKIENLDQMIKEAMFYLTQNVEELLEKARCP